MAIFNLLISRAAGKGFKYYNYDPSKAAAIVFCILFAMLTLLHLYQMFRTRTWYFVPFCIGGLLEVIGYLARFSSANETPNWSEGPFIAQTLGILLGPTLFAASVYMVLARIILLTEGEALSFVRRRWLTTIFVCGDVFSFLVQALGGSMMASGSASTIKRGQNIILIGLFAQIVFFGLFLLNSAIFAFRLHKRPTPRSEEVPWIRHLATLFSVSALILIRSIYRVIEYLQGRDGNLMDHEVYLYVLDATLMVLVMLIFTVIHPSEVTALCQGGKAARFLSVHEIHKSGGNWGRVSSVSLLPVGSGRAMDPRENIPRNT